MKVFDRRNLGSIITSVILLLILYFLQQQGIVSLDQEKDCGTARMTKLTPKIIVRSEVAGASESAVLVRRVVDGDTIQLETGETVRYIGIDTPETKDPRRGVQCFGKEASARNRELVEGKRVLLEKDVSETDKYGRLLRYVYVEVPGSEIFVNDSLVKEGFAHASAYPPDVAKQDVFDASEREARNNNRGLWSSCK